MKSETRFVARMTGQRRATGVDWGQRTRSRSGLKHKDRAIEREKGESTKAGASSELGRVLRSALSDIQDPRSQRLLNGVMGETAIEAIATMGDFLDGMDPPHPQPEPACVYEDDEPSHAAEARGVGDGRDATTEWAGYLKVDTDSCNAAFPAMCLS